MNPGFSFELLHEDQASKARRSRLTTPHGAVALPAFMPVGTQGTVKGLDAPQLRTTGAEMVLANAYHLALRPGVDVVAELGGLHALMGWDGPILTDSGGFQMVSLAARTQVREEGALFRSHIDGTSCELSPERAVEIQQRLGSDIAMVLDHVVPLPSDPQKVREAAERTVRWAVRCQGAATAPDQALFGIVQGGLDAPLRVWCAEQLAALDLDGCAVGGLSVGESHEEMLDVLDVTLPVLPRDKPRYLMGVGRPEDLLEAIRRGIDLFDCVMPTRNGRNALAFTDHGPMRLRNQKYQRDRRPLDPSCPCPACRHSRGYLRHLFAADEMLGPILVSAHNLTYYQRLMAEARQAIEEDRYEDYAAAKLLSWRQEPSL